MKKFKDYNETNEGLGIGVSEMKKFNDFIKESMENNEGFTMEQLYDEGAMIINRASKILNREDLMDEDPEDVMDALKNALSDMGNIHRMAIRGVIGELESIQDMIDNFPDQDECDECGGEGCEWCPTEEEY